ncbi:MAG: GNAT family N-acetyltransferase [Pseudomonadota bacterium]
MTDIRRARAEDAPACAAIVTRWIAGTRWLTQGPTQEQVSAALREGLPKREAYVIGDPVQGYLSMETEISHIWGFYVAKRGLGLGRLLMDHVKQGRDYLRLNSHAPNLRAHGFYRREGFQQVGDPWPGDDGVDEIRMEWHR